MRSLAWRLLDRLMTVALVVAVLAALQPADAASGPRFAALNGTSTLADGANLVFGTSTGTKLGTAANQKVGFHNVAVIQGAAVAALTDNMGASADGTLADLASVGAGVALGANPTTVDTRLGTIEDNLAELNASINSLRTRLSDKGVIAP